MDDDDFAKTDLTPARTREAWPQLAG